MDSWVKTSLTWLSAGWFWPLVLLALPTCGLDTTGANVTHHLDPGPGDHTFGVFCDIPKANSPRCATDNDKMKGIPLNEAAVALREGRESYIGLDYSPAALAKSAQDGCPNEPQAIDFEGVFPNGYVVCLNCNAQMPSVYADGNAVCAAQCHDLIVFYGSPAPSDSASDNDVTAYCEANAHVSTNFPKNSCAENACSAGGNFFGAGFHDRRKFPEPVTWTDQVGTFEINNVIRRETDASGVGNDAYSAGAVSKETITTGDAYVEFEAFQSDKTHVLGLSMRCEICKDNDPGLGDIAFGIVLYSDQQIYLVESATFLNSGMSFGTYDTHDRFRIEVKDLFDSGVHITYSRVVGECMSGEECVTDPIYEHDVPGSVYPLRADVSFIEEGAQLVNVQIVFIHHQ